MFVSLIIIFAYFYSRIIIRCVCLQRGMSTYYLAYQQNFTGVPVVQHVENITVGRHQYIRFYFYTKTHVHQYHQIFGWLAQLNVMGFVATNQYEFVSRVEGNSFVVRWVLMIGLMLCVFNVKSFSYITLGLRLHWLLFACMFVCVCAFVCIPTENYFYFNVQKAKVHISVCAHSYGCVRVYGFVILCNTTPDSRYSKFINEYQIHVAFSKWISLKKNLSFNKKKIHINEKWEIAKRMR